MNTRFLTLLTTLIFLGFTVSAYAIKPDNDYPRYDVWIDWVEPSPGSALVPGIFLAGKGLGWIWNGTQVGSTYAQHRVFPLDMTYISPLVGNFSVNDDLIGYECFESEVEMGGFFRKAKKDTANGMFWFHGFTKFSIPNVNRKAVLYQLKIDGIFFPGTKGFPGNGEVMYMSDWTLSVANQGKNVTERSCVGSGTFWSDDETDNDFVKVTFDGPK